MIDVSKMASVLQVFPAPTDRSAPAFGSATTEMPEPKKQKTATGIIRKRFLSSLASKFYNAKNSAETLSPTNFALDEPQQSKHKNSFRARLRSALEKPSALLRGRPDNNGSSANKNVCECHRNDYPPWTSEIHGMNQALQSRSTLLRIFWWTILALCTVCGTMTTVLVVIEYHRGPTATSTTIRLVPSLELPAITICPKIPDAFDEGGLVAEIFERVPELNGNHSLAIDLVRFWLGGSGLENMDGLSMFSSDHLSQLERLFRRWTGNITDPKRFFDRTHEKYGYKCEELFSRCELGGIDRSCCGELFRRTAVMRRGLCYQTVPEINQTESDDIGRLVVEMNDLPSVTADRSKCVCAHSKVSEKDDCSENNGTVENTSPETQKAQQNLKKSKCKQPQIIVYVSDKFENVLDFPRYYLYPNEWNRMHFTARLIELLDKHTRDCTAKLVGKDTVCALRNWLNANVVDQFNCTLPYLTGVSVGEGVPVCEPAVVAAAYHETIQLVHSGTIRAQECIPGCRRWEYTVGLQQSSAFHPFNGFQFNLEASFYDLQYEHVKEVVTTSVPGFMSQIGGQFGFFLGLSIITMLQMAVYAVVAIGALLYRCLQIFVKLLFRISNTNNSGSQEKANGAVSNKHSSGETTKQQHQRKSGLTASDFESGSIGPMNGTTSAAVAKQIWACNVELSYTRL